MTATLLHCSASQVEQFRLCKRRWYFRWHRPDIKEPPSDALELGTEIHGVLERYYEPAPVPDLKYPNHVAHQSVADLLLDPRLPPKTADVRTEFPRDYNLGITAAGVPVRGRSDLLWARTPTHLSVIDLKTTSSWKWAKSAEQLAENTQLLIYGAWAFLRMPVETVDFTHLQVLTKKRGYDVVTTRPLDREHVLSRFHGQVEPTVAEMKVVYAAEKPEDVEPTYASCVAFGRPCPYADVCPKSITAGIDADLETTTNPEGVGMSLAEKLKAKRAAAIAAAPNTGTPNTGTPDSVRAAQIESLEKLSAAATATEDVAAALNKKNVRAKGINPPDAAPVTTTAAPVTPPGVGGSATPQPASGDASGTSVEYAAVVVGRQLEVDRIALTFAAALITKGVPMELAYEYARKFLEVRDAEYAKAMSGVA